MDAIRTSQGGQELEGVLKDIQVSELRQAALGLGLNLGESDVQWNRLISQFDNVLSNLEKSNENISGIFALYHMIENLKSDLLSVKNAAYLTLANILAEKDHLEFVKKQKQLKAKQRRDKKKEILLLQSKENEDSEGHDTVN
jgi:hypothetical protein